MQTTDMEQSTRSVLLASKFRGCLAGSHVGDCFGAFFEGQLFLKEHLVDHIDKWSRDTRDEVVAKMEKYTDDTAMTLCIADSLIENRGFAAKDMASRFVQEFESNPSRRYGLNVVAVFIALRKANFIDPFGPASQQFEGSGSYGNGSSMRVAPVALYTYNDEDKDAVKLAKEQSLITHSHQNGYNGAILQCLAIRQALKTNPDDKIDPIAFIDGLIEKMTLIEKTLTDAGSSNEEDTRPYYSSLKKMRKIFKSGKRVKAKEIAKLLGNDVTAHRSVSTAIYSFLKSLQPCKDFEQPNQFVRAIYHAVSVAGDTDTIAAMTGSISGAYHGLELIPQSFLTKCESIERSEQAADRLYKLCCGS